MINDHWKAGDLLINMSSYWSGTMWVWDLMLIWWDWRCWHFLVTLGLPPKACACFWTKCILSEMRCNSGRIINFPVCPWINGRDRWSGQETEGRKSRLEVPACTFCGGNVKMIWFSSASKEGSYLSLLNVKARQMQICGAPFVVGQTLKSVQQW